MTETKERGSIFRAAPGGLCNWGQKTDNPCTRKATEYRWPDSPEPTICKEHERVADTADDMDALVYALDALEEWMRGPVQAGPHNYLRTFAYAARDDARRQYAAAAARHRAAAMVADEGPASEATESEARTFEQAEALARSLQQADGLSNAFALLHDLDEAAFGKHDKWLLIDALEAATDWADEEVERCRREIL